jgi:hypothetical protein
VFYTRVADPNAQVQVPIGSIERFEVDENAMLPGGTCREADASTVVSAGLVTTVSDPVIAGLTAPLRIK